MYGRNSFDLGEANIEGSIYNLLDKKKYIYIYGWRSHGSVYAIKTSLHHIYLQSLRETLRAKHRKTTPGKNGFGKHLARPVVLLTQSWKHIFACAWCVMCMLYILDLVWTIAPWAKRSQVDIFCFVHQLDSTSMLLQKNTMLRCW